MSSADADSNQRRSTEESWKEFAHAPLVPFALAASAGIILDRYGEISFHAEVALFFVGMIGWLIAQQRRPEMAIYWLCFAVLSIISAYHHAHRSQFLADDIGVFASESPMPAKLRGLLDEEPARHKRPRPDPLLAVPKPETTTCVLAVTALENSSTGWTTCTGLVHLTIEGNLDGLHLGDSVEVVGRLWRPSGPLNPGERDYRAYLLDQRITAVMRSKRSSEGITRLEEGWRASIFGWFARIRSSGSRLLAESIQPDEAGLAAALLLGDSNAMERDGWDKYVRTGVVHVLAISGQHLVILAWFLWAILRLVGVRRGRGAWIVASVIIGYVLVTGSRPSAVRSAVMVAAICGGYILRRRVMPANIFALAWLAIIAIDPADPFNPGCQLSFLSVFTLIWGVGRWVKQKPLTPLEQLVEESRSIPTRILRQFLRLLRDAFIISFVLGIVNAPLVLAWQNIISPVGIVIGPPLVVLTGIALIFGFLFLPLAALSPTLARPFGFVVASCLHGCESIVDFAEHLPGNCIYAPGPALWWLVGFYLGLAGVVLLSTQYRRSVLAGLAVWSFFGLILSFERSTHGETRATFLAVGHGGCVVIETTDGRILLYDVGATVGPEHVRRVVAPFLWSRSIARIDEVFISHADLDHFNGLPELLRRFPISQVTLTPTFADKESPGVSAVLTILEKNETRLRIASRGDRFTAGDVAIEVLHPPAEGPEGNENVRSMVLLLRHEGHTLLLTGDLEGVGQEIVTSKPIKPVDVMLAPHHGGIGANATRTSQSRFEPGRMALWARPKLVISSQQTGDTRHLWDSYGVDGSRVLDTATSGAIVVHSHSTGVTVESFRGGEIEVIRRGRE